MCVSEEGHILVGAIAWRGQKKILDLLKLVLQVIESRQTCDGNWTVAPVRSVSTLNCWAIFSRSQCHLFKLILIAKENCFKIIHAVYPSLPWRSFPYFNFFDYTDILPWCANPHIALLIIIHYSSMEKSFSGCYLDWYISSVLMIFLYVCINVSQYIDQLLLKDNSFPAIMVLPKSWKRVCFYCAPCWVTWCAIPEASHPGPGCERFDNVAS